MSLAIVPGSFDPMTLGHLDVVCEARKRYDEVVVAVMINDAKRYLFDMQTRVAIAQATVSALPSVSVIADDGMLIDLYDRLGADAVCKGWRNETDLAYEQEMAEWNRAHNPRFQTVLYRSEGEHRSLSSTEVRSMIAQGASLAPFVHAEALPIITNYLSKERV